MRESIQREGGTEGGGEGRRETSNRGRVYKLLSPPPTHDGCRPVNVVARLQSSPSSGGGEQGARG